MLFLYAYLCPFLLLAPWSSMLVEAYFPLCAKFYVFSVGLLETISLGSFAHQGKIVYVGISPHPAQARTLWELLLLLC